MKFAIISDIHIGPQSSFRGMIRKLGDQALDLTQAFVEKMNSEVLPEFVVNLGDMIQDESPELDKKRFQEGVALLSKLNCPVFHLFGNHDLAYLAIPDLLDWTKQQSTSFSYAFSNVHVIGLHTTPSPELVFSVAENDVNWLVKELDQAVNPVVVLLHPSLADQDVSENFWFNGREVPKVGPRQCLVEGRAGIRSVLESSGKVAAVINGHLHWNNLTWHNKIPHITLQSLVENFRGDGTPAATWTVCDVGEGRLTIEQGGFDGARYVVPLPRMLSTSDTVANG